MVESANFENDTISELTMENILRKRNVTYISPYTVVAVSLLFISIVLKGGAIFEIFTDAFLTFSLLQEELARLDSPSSKSFFVVVLVTLSVFSISLFLWSKKSRSVYLIDFSVFRGEEKLRVSQEIFCNLSEAVHWFTEDSLNFQRKILARSGLGEETNFPRNLFNIPPSITLESARGECTTAFNACITEVLERCNLKVKDIDILITNCSLFNPTPSLSEMIINHFKMRGDIKNFNLAGMGCSAGLISMKLANDLLQTYPNSRCLIFSTETVTQSWYRGNDKSMMLANCLFRMGGAAMVLSNRPVDRFRAKYRLDHVVRVNKCRDDESYYSIFQKEDKDNMIGVSLSKDLVKHVSNALSQNLSILGPLILPISEQVKFGVNYVQRKIFKSKKQAYTPDFTKAVDHICIHAGGRAIIDGLEKNLNLPNHLTLPSRAALYAFGNTSSASIWYELAFIERHVSVGKGERVWQLAFGSGVNCNSAIWTSLRNIHDKSRFEWNVSGLLQNLNEGETHPESQSASRNE